LHKVSHCASVKYNFVKDTLERLNRLRLRQAWSWLALSQNLGISYSMLNKVKSGERGLSDVPLFRLAQLELDAGLKLEADDPAAQLYKTAQPYTLDTADLGGSEAGHWKRRALDAERKLHELRLRLGALLRESDPAAPPVIAYRDKPSVTRRGKVTSVEAGITGEAARELLEAEEPAPQKKKGKN